MDSSNSLSKKKMSKKCKFVGSGKKRRCQCNGKFAKKSRC